MGGVVGRPEARVKSAFLSSDPAPAVSHNPTAILLLSLGGVVEFGVDVIALERLFRRIPRLLTQEMLLGTSLARVDAAYLVAQEERLLGASASERERLAVDRARVLRPLGRRPRGLAREGSHEVLRAFRAPVRHRDAGRCAGGRLRRCRGAAPPAIRAGHVRGRQRPGVRRAVGRHVFELFVDDLSKEIPLFDVLVHGLTGVLRAAARSGVETGDGRPFALKLALRARRAQLDLEAVLRSLPEPQAERARRRVALLKDPIDVAIALAATHPALAEAPVLLTASSLPDDDRDGEA